MDRTATQNRRTDAQNPAGQIAVVVSGTRSGVRSPFYGLPVVAPRAPRDRTGYFMASLPECAPQFQRNCVLQPSGCEARATLG